MVNRLKTMKKDEPKKEEISEKIPEIFSEKVYNIYDPKVLIGFTATPITNKNEIKKVIDAVTKKELIYKRRQTMSLQYDILITGVTEQKLIDLGYLTQDFNVALKMPGMDKLVRSETNPDGFTTDSLNEVYANRVAYDLLWEAYEKHGIGKKSIIFNATTKVNLEVFEFFKERGVNCMCYDSVNKVTDMSRKEVIAWFKEETEGVLINCNVFTTGFDVTDIEVVILNRATKSLSLFLQMAGRGSRITDKIFKDKFTVLDLGQNFVEHGLWSLERDWDKLFKPNKWKLKNPPDTLQLWECNACGYYNEAGTVLWLDGLLHCLNCGAPKTTNHPDRKLKDGKLVVVSKQKPPKAKQIIDYTKRVKENATFAFKLLDKLIVDLFIDHEISVKNYLEREERFTKRIDEIYRGVYFAIIRDEELTGKRRKLATQLENIHDKIRNHYEL